MIHLTIAIILAAMPIGSFEYRATPPASLFPFCQAAADPSLPDAISNPAYLPPVRFAYLHFSGSMPYTLGALYASTLRAGYGTHGFGIQAVWDRFGFDEYLEHVVELNLGYMPVKYVSIGAGARYYNLAIDTVQSGLRTHQADGRFSVVIAPCRWFEVAFIQENIGSLFIKKRRGLLFPEWSAGAVVKPFRGFTLAYNINFTAAGYVNCVSASANLLKYFSLRAGYAREAETFSAALTFIYKHVSASYGIKYHPHLGLTHAIGVTLSLSDMSVEPISYGALFPQSEREREQEPVDINSCSYDELAAVPGITGQHAERIMKYRKTIGPLGHTGLLQVGMSEEEIRLLLPRVKGLASEAAPAAHDFKQRAAFEQAHKRLFTDLVGLGLPASTALELSELAIQGRREALAEKIGALRFIDRQTKKRVLEACIGPQ
jgi:hypothetical protein